MYVKLIRYSFARITAKFTMYLLMVIHNVQIYLVHACTLLPVSGVISNVLPAWVHFKIHQCVILCKYMMSFDLSPCFRGDFLPVSVVDIQLTSPNITKLSVDVVILLNLVILLKYIV